MVQLLLEAGAPVNQQTAAGGATALHRAAYMGHGAIISLLLSHGADAMLQDADGETPLHKAVTQGHAGATQLLLQAQPAAAAVRDRHCRTPLDRAPPGMAGAAALCHADSGQVKT